MAQLLLVSTSTTYGSGYLDHCAAQMGELFGGVAGEEGRSQVLFVPYALLDRDAYAARAKERFAAVDLALTSIHEAVDPIRAVEQAAGLFVGGGNTFRLLKALWDQGLVEPIRRRVRDGLPYMGTSAGVNVAGPTMETSNDMPILYPPTFEALALVPFNLNPHYLDKDPRSTHMGESRATRIAEFLEEHDRPVVALREGAMLRVEDRNMALLGSRGGRLFRRHEDPLDLEPGAQLDFLLES